MANIYGAVVEYTRSTKRTTIGGKKNKIKTSSLNKHKRRQKKGFNR